MVPARRKVLADTGASSVELAITMPALLLMVLAIIQFALWEHAQHVALAAAQEGAAIARSYDGTEAEARVRTLVRLDQLGPTILSHRSVSVTRTPTEVTVTVVGRATSVLGVFGLHVHEQARGPVERFVPTRGDAP